MAPHSMMRKGGLAYPGVGIYNFLIFSTETIAQPRSTGYHTPWAPS